MKSLKERITKIIETLNDGIFERDEVIAVSLLAALSDQNVFLFGPPGTAKSLIARRLSHAFETNSYFEYLMQRFSTPEEVFGPVSITELKKDNYLRKTEGFLPESDFAFLDEIWKSSPAILNTLLTIINEKLFRNGTKTESVPLKTLIVASNETPPKGQGLEALYDRFLVRLNVLPMEERRSFESLLQAKPTNAKLTLPDGLAITHKEWETWCDEIHSIQLSKETLSVIHDIRIDLEEKGEELGLYVSDRCWQKSAILMKAAAFFCDRKTTNLVDTLLLRHCLWTTRDNHEEMVAIVENSVKKSGFVTNTNLYEVDLEKEELEKEIYKELFYSEDVYETKSLHGKSYFQCTKEYETHQGYNSQKKRVTFYIPVNMMKSQDKFNPVDEQGNYMDWIQCHFDTQGTCSIEIDYYYRTQRNVRHRNHSPHWENLNSFSPKILFHKGDKKVDVNRRLIESLSEAVLGLQLKIEGIIKQIKKQLEQFKKELETPFVPENIREIAFESVKKQLHEMELRHKDCDRLRSLTGNRKPKNHHQPNRSTRNRQKIHAAG